MTKTDIYATALYAVMLVTIAAIFTLIIASGFEIRVYDMPPMANVTMPVYEMLSSKNHHLFVTNDNMIIDIAYNK